MRYGFAILIFFVGSIIAIPASIAGSGATVHASSSVDPNVGNPLTPTQIAGEFLHLPLVTQKMLIRILMSQSSEQEKQDTTEQLDGIFATLPPEVQTSLYAKWNGLTDEQRIALKQIDPTTMKALLDSAFKSELAQLVPDAAPIKKAIEQGRTFAEESRAYVQKLIYRRSSAEIAER